MDQGLMDRQVTGRNTFPHLFTILKKTITDAVQAVFSKDMSVRVSNEKIFFSYFNRLAAKAADLESLVKEANKHLSDSKVERTAQQRLTAQLASELYSQLENIRHTTQGFIRYFEGTEQQLGELLKKDMVVNVPEFPKIEFPKVQQIRGLVKVDNQVDVSELKSITKKVEEVTRAIERIKFPDFPKIDIPKVQIPKMPDSVSLKEKEEILSALIEVKNAIASIEIPTPIFPTSVEVSNFPVQRYPIPPTRMSINPLRGEVKSRNITVTTTPTPLPDEVLRYRRTVLVYNAGSQTIYIGGSDVTISNGLPVPSSSYSPSLDAGPRMILYGVAAGSVDVRVLEVSDEDVGRSQ